MGQAITRHPAVVLRSQYDQLRALLAIALVAVVGLCVALAILATNDEGTITPASSAQSIESISYGGFNPQTGGPLAARFRVPEQVAQTPVQPARADGGPEESSVAAAIAQPPEVARPDESKVAASLARFEQAQLPSRHDESTVAEAISRRK